MKYENGVVYSNEVIMHANSTSYPVGRLRATVGLAVTE
jgi:hypothetical protein